GGMGARRGPPRRARGGRGEGVRQRRAPPPLHARAPGARGDRLLDRARPPALHAARQGDRARLGLRHSPPRAGAARDGPLMFLAAGGPPEKTALVDDRVRLTWADLRRLAERVAAGLATRGVRAGEVVSCVLPNRAEAAVLFHAVHRMGAVLNPIVPVYGAREIRFILRQAESVAVVVPERFRGVDFPALMGRVRPDLPSLREVLVVEGVEALPQADGPVVRRRDPDQVAVILYTSGTTAEP